MFKLTRPCASCPFKPGQGERFQLCKERLREIMTAPAFQCHKTVDYDAEYEGRAGDHPQQCAGLMILLHRADRPNQIMQVGERLKGFDPARLELSAGYPSIFSAVRAHLQGVNR